MPSVGRPWKRACAWLAFLGPFFFVTYGFANWAASRRADVGAIVFDWERQIPFAAWSIVPYWSIDFFYALSLFVCASRAELDTHGKRLACAQVIAVACFLLVPLRFTFDKPDTGGVPGFMFDVLAVFDLPYNQAPSLHVALLVILWVLYAKYVAGPLRWLLHAWFALIGVSILTTWQHHFIDFPTGIWLGWLCVWLFPDACPALLSDAHYTADPVRRRLALRYAGGGALLGGIALALNGWALWLAWVAGALLLVASIYAFFDGHAFQKQEDGVMSAASAWLLAPYFAGAWLNSRWWTRSIAHADTIVPGLMLGRSPTARERRALGATAIVDLAAELPVAAGGAHYVRIAFLDLVAPTVAQLTQAVDEIERAWPHGPVLVCCALGLSRSAAAVAAWLVATGRAPSVDAAVAHVRHARGTVVLGPEHMEALHRYAQNRPRSVSDERAR